jgi:hypothetical protein
LPQELRITGRVDHAGGKVEHSGRSRVLCCRDHLTVLFKKQNFCHKPGTFVSVQKRMILDDTERAGGGRVNDIDAAALSSQKSRPCQGGLEQSNVPQSLGAAVKDQKPVMQCQTVRRLDPNERRLAH